MKRSWLKRGTKGFKNTRSTLKRGAWTAKPRPIRVLGQETTKDLKEDIQALLREIVILRDGGCIFRDYPESGECGGYRKDGDLILQFDHLNSRTHSVSYADPRLGVCVCLRHHFYWKKQYPADYERIIREVIGNARCKLLDLVRMDKSPHKVDWKMEKVALQMELKTYE